MIQHLSYDEPTLSHHRVVANLVVRELPLGGTVADIGCGLGQMLDLVQRARPDAALLGIDGDASCVAAARERLLSARIEHLDAMDVSSLGQGSVDVVVMSHSLEHFPDPPAILASARGLLTRTGRMVLAVPNALQATVIAREVAGRGRSNEGHYYIWNRATFENCLALCGFRIIDHHHDDVPLVPQRLRHRAPRLIGSIERTAARAVPALSYSVITVVEPIVR